MSCRVLENELRNKRVMTRKTIKIQSIGERRNIMWAVITSRFIIVIRMIKLKEPEIGGICTALGDANKYVDLGLNNSREDFMGVTQT